MIYSRLANLHALNPVRIGLAFAKLAAAKAVTQTEGVTLNVIASQNTSKCACTVGAPNNTREGTQRIAIRIYDAVIGSPIPMINARIKIRKIFRSRLPF